jgi:glycerol kinase
VMQSLADVLNTRVTNIGFEDVSALGAAYMAGLESGIFESLDHLPHLNPNEKSFTPGANRAKVLNAYQQWETTLQGLF